MKQPVKAFYLGLVRAVAFEELGSVPSRIRTTLRSKVDLGGDGFKTNQ